MRGGANEFGVSVTDLVASERSGRQSAEQCAAHDAVLNDRSVGGAGAELLTHWGEITRVIAISLFGNCELLVMSRSIYRTDIVIRVLDIAILGLLMERDHHGYEVRAQLRDRLGLWANVSFGSIYPALARLERTALVEAVAGVETRFGSLSTGSLAGERAALRSLRTSPALGRKGRKVYRITQKGREEFAQLLEDPATLDDARSFSLRMALARYLSPRARVGLLELRRSNLGQRLYEVRQQAANQQLDNYARSVMNHGAQAVELEIAWIDDLLIFERNNQPAIAREAN